MNGGPPCCRAVGAAIRRPEETACQGHPGCRPFRAFARPGTIDGATIPHPRDDERLRVLAVLTDNDAEVALQFMGLCTLLVGLRKAHMAKRTAEETRDEVQRMSTPNGNKPLTQGGSLADALIRIDRNIEEHAAETRRRFDGVDERIAGVDRRIAGLDDRLISVEKGNT